MTVKRGLFYSGFIVSHAVKEDDTMNDLDHMLNGNASRQHHQDMIHQAQQAKIVRDLKSAKGTRQTAISLRMFLASVIHLIVW